MKIDRRKFLTFCSLQGIQLAGLSAAFPNPGPIPGVEDLIDGKHIFETKKAQFFTALPNQRIRCEICPRKCEVDHLERGFCGTRENRKGTYYVLTYANPCAVHIDPIEKKPFFHFLPASRALSLSTAGCNLMCKFCQNWQISQFRPEQTDNIHLPPEGIVDIARNRSVPVIAYTYAEPVVFYEYMYDCSRQSRRYGIKNVMISAGFIEEKPLRKLVKVLDAVKIDLKAFTQKYYQEICSGDLKPVLDCLQVLADEKIWFEIVYLVVPTLNDNLADIKKMSAWIRQNLGSEVPIHYSRFYPTYMLKNLPPTPVATLEKIRNASLDAGLNYVYIGNVMGHEGENTFCPGCHRVLIRRVGYQILENHIQNGRCEYCGRSIPGVWSKK